MDVKNKEGKGFKANLRSVWTGMLQLVGKCQRKHLIFARLSVFPRIWQRSVLKWSSINSPSQRMWFSVMMMDSLPKMTFSHHIRKPCTSEVLSFQLKVFTDGINDPTCESGLNTSVSHQVGEKGRTKAALSKTIWKCKWQLKAFFILQVVHPSFHLCLPINTYFNSSSYFNH